MYAKRVKNTLDQAVASNWGIFGFEDGGNEQAHKKNKLRHEFGSNNKGLTLIENDRPIRDLTILAWLKVFNALGIAIN